jgi:small ligand-binding sensory domain FIST
MKPFLHAHATHPDWRMALALVATQLEAQRTAVSPPAAPTLGWVYFSDLYAAQAAELLAQLQLRWPGVAWVGAATRGVAASGVEYFDEPALSVMLAEMPTDQFRVFSGVKPLAALIDPTASAGAHEPQVAQVHADPATADLGELITELSERTATGYLFGGLASSRSADASRPRGLPTHVADGVFEGGLSGVAFGPDVRLVSRVTQGCQPIGASRTVTEADRNVVMQLDGKPALDCLLEDLGLESARSPDALLQLRQTLVGLSEGRGDALSRPGQFGADTRVRHLIGLDPQRRTLAIGDTAVVGNMLAFCRRDRDAARRDLVRICAEIREELEPQELPLETAQALARAGGRAAGASVEPGPAPRHIAGAIYVSCIGRGGPHFGAPSAELAIVKHALGDVPLVGFFAAGEIARHHLYSYTGVLTVFAAQA